MEAPDTVPGDIIIPWNCVGCKTDYNTLFALYNVFPASTYTFVGYWGDVCTVQFLEFDQPVIRARLYDMSGSFRVISVTSYSNASLAH